MSIPFRCPHCDRGMKVPDRQAGMRAKCPGCGKPIQVPGGGPPAAKKPPPREAEPPEPVRFTVKRTEDEGLDMTPMVDITFLLLIFFMVTAAFSLQKSLAVPPPNPEEQAQNATRVEQPEEEEDIVVRVYKDGTVWVEGSEATVKQQIIEKLRRVRDERAAGGQMGASSLLVLAHEDARHESVVMALDAGNAVGMEPIKLATVDDEDFWEY